MNEKNKKVIERESMGIKKVDDMLNGGLPKGAIVAISGPPGVGKSIFSLSFLLEGARKGDKCIYINLEEPEENIKMMINQFEFADEFNKHMEDKKIVIKCYSYSEYEKINLELLKKIREDKDIKRLVIDSFNCFFSATFNESKSKNARKSIMNMFSLLRRQGLTSLLILESNSQFDFLYNIPYMVDGIINLDYLELGVIERRLFVQKMRWTSQCKEGKSFAINKKGITILD